MSNLFYIKFKTTHAVYARPFKGEDTIIELMKYIESFLNGPDEKFISIISIENFEELRNNIYKPLKEKPEDWYQEFVDFCKNDGFLLPIDKKNLCEELDRICAGNLSKGVN